MKKIIIYGSQYGTTKRYADEISERTGIKALDYTEVKNLSAYDTVLYLGGLYAGGVLGLKETIKKFHVNPKQRLIIVTVGLADPQIKENTDNIKRSVSNQISKDIYDRCKIFHLRGGIDYQMLNLKHKFMMKLIYDKTKKLPPEQQNEESKALIDTYNKKVDFVNFNALDKIIEVFLAEHDNL